MSVQRRIFPAAAVYGHTDAGIHKGLYALHSTDGSKIEIGDAIAAYHIFDLCIRHIGFDTPKTVFDSLLKGHIDMPERIFGQQLVEVVSNIVGFIFEAAYEQNIDGTFFDRDMRFAGMQLFAAGGNKKSISYSGAKAFDIFQVGPVLTDRDPVDRAFIKRIMVTHGVIEQQIKTGDIPKVPYAFALICVHSVTVVVESQHGIDPLCVKRKEFFRGSIEFFLNDISKNKISVICKNILKIPFNTENTIAPSIWSKLYKAELIKDAYSVVPDGQSFGEDILCLCVCILKADTMFLTKNAYYHYIIRENSMSHIRESKDIIKYTGLYVSLCNLFKNFNLYDEVDKYLEAFLMQYITSYMSYMYRGSIYIGRYRFGNIHMLRGKKVVIYGAGRVGQDYYCQIAGYKECTIVGWIDKMFSRYKFDYAQVQEISALKSMNYDKLIVAVRDKTIADEIIKTLCELGIEKGKVVWTKPCVCCLPVNKINLY